ncbi:MAG: crossover junction endodeoxyribonuclease RuvC [bacterium]
MIILGIDPGTADTGFGVVQIENSKIKSLGYGSIKTKAGEPMPERLWKLYCDLQAVFKKFKPDIVSIEKIFFNTNAKTAMSVGQARGVAMLLAGQHKVAVVEYTALQAKLALTGYGRAEKKVMQKRVGEILKIKEKITPNDAADGLAMALCHLVKEDLVKYV